MKITHKSSAALYDIKIIVFNMIRAEVSTKCQALTSWQSIINSSQCAPLFSKLILRDEMRLLPDLRSQLVLDVFYT